MNLLSPFFKKSTGNAAEASHPPSTAYPKSLKAAVERLCQTLDDEQKRRLAAMPEKSVEGLNYGLGAQIRRDFGLWHGNPALMRSCGEHNPEDTSMVIIRATWAHLQPPSIP